MAREKKISGERKSRPSHAITGPPGTSAGTHTAIDRLIHEPARYQIMASLYVLKRAEFLFIRNHTQLTPGNLSSHLAKLESAGYVLIQKEFAGKVPRTYLSLTAAGRKAFEAYRSGMITLLGKTPDSSGI